MKTIVYIDDCNYYCGCLMHSGDGPGNEQLSQYADWTRRHTTDAELVVCQLPVKIPTQKKPIIKPEYW